MPIEFSLSDEPFNTQYAPLAVLLALYQQNQVLQLLEQVVAPEKKVLFSTCDKLEQVLTSILAGCDTLSEVNTKLHGDQPLAQAGGWVAFADQSTLSLTLDALTLTNLTQLQQCQQQLLQLYGYTGNHDWRGFLWLDYDLSGLPCSKRYEGSQKGYFSQKKQYRTAVGTGECGPIPRNSLVWLVSWQCSYRQLFPDGSPIGANFIRVR